jgi:hypothetical protein
MLGETSKAQVAAALRNAEAKADMRTCGMQTAQLVRSAFGKMQSR